MKHPIHVFSAFVLSGLLGCSHTPPQTADDSNATAVSETTATATDAPSPASVSPTMPADSTASNAALAPGASATDAPTRAEAKDLVASPPATPPSSPSAAPDNTKVNKRDTDAAAMTPVDQGNNETDLKITQQIRQAVMADGSLSFTAKNVKIITSKGKVTLRGPVNNAAERSAIEAAARKVAGTNVDNQIEVKK